jgi:hypothetical protein
MKLRLLDAIKQFPNAVTQLKESFPAAIFTLAHDVDPTRETMQDRIKLTKRREFLLNVLLLQTLLRSDGM